MIDTPDRVSINFEERTEEEEIEDARDQDDEGDDEGDDATEEETEPETVALDWVNSASVHVAEEDDSIAVSISVGDPRGAFTMEIRRCQDGTLMLYLPYDGMSFAHMPITKVMEGTYRIGHHGATDQ